MDDPPTSPLDNKRRRISSPFDVRIRTLFGNNRQDMPACIEIARSSAPVKKENGISLIILADVSGSMLHDRRIQHMREGIVRLADLSRRPTHAKVDDMTLIAFSDGAQVIRMSSPMPAFEELRQACDDLTPGGGTNIGAALREAMRIAESKPMTSAIHVALFTDGEDTCGLAASLKTDFPSYMRTLKERQRLYVHCVGICTDVDCCLLDQIARTARRGTFQCITETNIARLTGAMWGMMVEVVDEVSFVDVFADETPLVAKKDVLLRISPMTCLVPVPRVAAGTKTLTATLTVGNTSQTARLDLSSVGSDAVDEVCASEHLAVIQGNCCAEVGQALALRDFDRATKANANAVASVEELLGICGLAASAVLNDLEAQARDINVARDSYEAARELEARVMSQSSTVRNGGMTIDPDSHSLSELQTQLMS